MTAVSRTDFARRALLRLLFVIAAALASGCSIAPKRGHDFSSLGDDAFSKPIKIWVRSWNSDIPISILRSDTYRLLSSMERAQIGDLAKSIGGRCVLLAQEVDTCVVTYRWKYWRSSGVSNLWRDDHAVIAYKLEYKGDKLESVSVAVVQFTGKDEIFD
ncbi:hypothetical protein OPU71_18150 [Niveibacterium sp. 24ML]|uniref:hypothetical protein n=1 Tax=Niveibacterium sp. 24ML TaxID=2985512 RepID=UPI002270198E|nr:hypothetical protein [Niveibacterium sp. 24ML]MCX9158048.1 hypothetical protein [Niveibacterium sp. 24ML]